MTSQNSHHTPSVQQTSIFEYLAVIIKRKRIIFRTTAGVFILSILVSLSLPNKYQSTAKFIPPAQLSGLSSLLLSSFGGSQNFPGVPGDLFGKTSIADQYVSILGSDRINDAIIDRFKLMEVYKQDSRIDMYTMMDSFVFFEIGKKDGIISVTIEDKDPQRAADIANAYLEELFKMTGEISQAGGNLNRIFLEKTLTQERSNLARAEDEMKAFQSKNKTIDISEQVKTSIAGIASLRGQLALQEVQLSELRRRYTDSSQEVKSAKSMTADLRSQIAQLEGAGHGGSIPAMGTVPGIGQEYYRLLRELKIRENLVEALTKQFELYKLVAKKGASDIQIIQDARVPDKKSKPKRSTLVIGATAIWLLFAIVISFVLEYFEKTPPEDKKQLQNILSSLTRWKEY